jgi:ElaA protein
VQVVSSSFAELSPTEAYAAWRLRQEVFVVEQDCPYPDLDGRDLEPATRHLRLLADDGTLLGYARVLSDPGEWRIGRVVLTPSARGQGLADLLLRHALAETTDRDVVLDAQSPLAGWYATFGFEIDGPEFVEDGIPHLPMRLRH